MDRKLESRIARLERILSKRAAKNEQMFSKADISEAIKDAYNALIFLQNASSDLDSNDCYETVSSMLDDLQDVANNWGINVGSY
jgi:hypothetical protein